MNEALLCNLSDQELVRYAGQQLPPELYSRLEILFDEREEDISTIEQLREDTEQLEELQMAVHRMKLVISALDESDIDEIAALGQISDLLQEL